MNNWEIAKLAMNTGCSIRRKIWDTDRHIMYHKDNGLWYDQDGSYEPDFNLDDWEIYQELTKKIKRYSGILKVPTKYDGISTVVSGMSYLHKKDAINERVNYAIQNYLDRNKFVIEIEEREFKI